MSFAFAMAEGDFYVLYVGLHVDVRSWNETYKKAKKEMKILVDQRKREQIKLSEKSLKLKVVLGAGEEWECLCVDDLNERF